MMKWLYHLFSKHRHERGRRLNAGVLFILLLCSGLASVATSLANTAPDWVSGDAGFYPETQYMIATGSAANVELAKNRALANLGKIFESHIKAVSTAHSNTQVVLQGGKEQVTKKQNLTQQIQIHTDKIVHGVRIAATWHDDTLHTHHALAVLNRVQAANNIKGEMSRLDDDTQVMLTRSEAPDVLMALSAINNVVKLQYDRQALQKMLKVIDIRGKGLPENWRLATLEGQLENQFKQLSIGAAIDNDPMGKLDLSLQSAMGNAGFLSIHDSPEFVLVANLDVQDIGLKQGWYWLRAKLSVKLVESNGRVRGEKQWSLKVSALEHNNAESRLLTQINKKLSNELKKTVLGFATAGI